jgi:hypothetical protein
MNHENVKIRFALMCGQYNIQLDDTRVIANKHTRTLPLYNRLLVSDISERLRDATTTAWHDVSIRNHTLLLSGLWPSSLDHCATTVLVLRYRACRQCATLFDQDTHAVRR